MRKKTLFIVLCLLSGILTLGGCGKSETDDAKTQKSEAKEEDEWEETPVAPIEKEDLKKIGVPLKGTVEIKLENNTGKSITGFAVKKSENSEFGENLLEDEDVYVKGEKRYFYYDYKQENSEEETETISADYDGNTEEETDESVPEYDIQITYLNGTTAVLHDFPFDDMKEGTLELEDEITYLTYTRRKKKSIQKTKNVVSRQKKKQQRQKRREKRTRRQQQRQNVRQRRRQQQNSRQKQRRRKHKNRRRQQQRHRSRHKSRRHNSSRMQTRIRIRMQTRTRTQTRIRTRTQTRIRIRMQTRIRTRMQTRIRIRMQTRISRRLIIQRQIVIQQQKLSNKNQKK